MAATSAPATTANYDELPWWLGVIQGVALVILGALCLSAPGATLVVLVQFAGIYWLVTGVLDLVSLLGDRTSWLWRLIAGIVGVLAGIVIVAHPAWATVLVPTTLILVVGIFGIVNGVLMAVQSFGVRHWSGVALGVFGMLIGVLLVMNPLIGASTLPVAIGVLAVAGGVVSIAVGFVERGARRRARRAVEPAPPIAVAAPTEAAPAEPDLPAETALPTKPAIEPPPQPDPAPAAGDPEPGSPRSADDPGASAAGT